ncbi:hypothetical protein [Marinifilum sp.]|uniref:hypothetical protein n=1 Tax=Marinifilum sp. TaxID=2033137 RepID=UPI003BAA28BD
MKKILSLIILAFAFVGVTNAQDQFVTVNTNHIYSVADEGLTYTWAVTGGTSTDLSAQKGASINILWDAAGTYTLTVFGTDGDGCQSETTTATIEVVGASSLLLAASSSDVITCSNLDGGLSGGLADQSVFELDFTGGVGPYDVTYEVRNSGGTVVVGPTTLTDVADGSDITIDNNFVNTSGSDEVYTVVITSATTEDGANVTLGDVTRTITVHSKPTISGTITLN